MHVCMWQRKRRRERTKQIQEIPKYAYRTKRKEMHRNFSLKFVSEIEWVPDIPELGCYTINYGVKHKKICTKISLMMLKRIDTHIQCSSVYNARSRTHLSQLKCVRMCIQCDHDSIVVTLRNELISKTTTTATTSKDVSSAGVHIFRIF